MDIVGSLKRKKAFGLRIFDYQIQKNYNLLS